MRRLIEAALAADAADPSRAEAVHAHAARFDWDRCASDYLALYARLLGSGAAA
jgi:glycogen synthase